MWHAIVSAFAETPVDAAVQLLEAHEQAEE